MANAFKSFGEQSHMDDLSLTIAGSIGAIMNGISRIFWPIYQDSTSFEGVSSNNFISLITGIQENIAFANNRIIYYLFHCML